MLERHWYYIAIIYFMYEHNRNTKSIITHLHQLGINSSNTKRYSKFVNFIKKVTIAVLQMADQADHHCLTYASFSPNCKNLAV